MILTSGQKTTLKANIQADGTLNTIPAGSDGDFLIAAAYNLPATPDFWVWRTKVTKDELVGSLSVDGTTFDWTGTGFMTRTQGERDAFNAIFGADGSVNPSIASVRTAFAAMLSGATAPAPANRTHLLTVARRKATRLEKLFATGTGSTAAPAVLVVEGMIDFPDVGGARSS